MWTEGTAYDAYVGRWSGPVAAQLVDWLGVAPGAAWLDVGCGTGALTRTILDRAAPGRVVGIDASAAFIDHARAVIADPRASFATGDAQALDVHTQSFDAVVSGLMMNFVPVPERAAAEMVRAARPGGAIAIYVWDYAGGMELLRRFWDAAAALDPAAAELDEGRQFPLCQPDRLAALLASAGAAAVDTRAIDVATPLASFDDYWTPFLGGQGPAPAYVARLTPACRDALRDRLRADLPAAPDRSIQLGARAWAVRGVRR